MSEAELTEQLLQIMELLFLGISVSFTIISAYIIGLYWFLHNANVLMRILAFGVFSMMMVLLAVASFGAFRHSAGVTLALEQLSKTDTLTILGTMALEGAARGVSDLIVFMAVVLSISLYLGLFYLTFFYKWAER